MAKNKSVNCGKTATILYNNNQINENTYNYIIQVHDNGNEAKHDGMSAGVPHLKDAVNQLYENKQIGDPVKKYLMDINKKGTEAKHHF
jgi:hypothetical protein